MRILIAVPALAALAACQVSKDDANDTVSVTYNQDVAENAAADIGNAAENIAADVGNEAQTTADKIDNKVDNGNDSNAASNKQ